MDPLACLLNDRFDVTYSDPSDLQQRHEEFFSSQDCFVHADNYFVARLESLASLLRANEPVFLTHIFHAVLGVLVTRGVLPQASTDLVAKYLTQLRSPGGGYLAIQEDYLDQFPKLRNAAAKPSVPEVYSTYYAYHLRRILGVDYSEQELDELLSWVLAHQHASGLIYSTQYSNTDQQWRMEAEKTAQLYFAVELISSILPQLPHFDLDVSLEGAQAWVHHTFPTLKTVGGRYFAFKAVYRLDPEAICDLGVEETLGFLADRRSQDGDGYCDYRLQDKRDEAMTSRSQVQLDKNSSHVFSTYYAATLQAHLSGVCRRDAKPDPQDLHRLVDVALNPGDGFGRPVLIKEYPTPYGPVSTDLETLLVALLPLLCG